jgi:hypothetical protein
LHFVDLRPARDWAASATIPFFGGLTATDRTSMLHGPLPELTWIYQLDRNARSPCSRRRPGTTRAPGQARSPWEYWVTCPVRGSVHG